MRDAGQLPQDWLDMVRRNADPASPDGAADYIAEWGNWGTVEVDDEGAVWVEGPGAGRWLNQDECGLVAKTTRVTSP